MNIEQQARVFDAAVAGGASTAEALRAVAEARRKLRPGLRALIQQRIAAGATIKEIAQEFSLSYPYAARVCRQVMAADKRRDVPTLAGEGSWRRILAETAAYFDITTRDLVARAAGSRHAPGSTRPARRTAALLLRASGMSYPEIALAMGRKNHGTAMVIIETAGADEDAIAAAREIAARLALSGEVEAAVGARGAA